MYCMCTNITECHSLIERRHPYHYFEPISEIQTSKSFPEPSVKSVRLNVIGTFWWTTTTELLHNLNRIYLNMFLPNNSTIVSETASAEIKIENDIFRLFS